METAQRTSHWTKRFCDRGSWPQIAHAFDTLIEPRCLGRTRVGPEPGEFRRLGTPIPEEMQK